MSSAFYDNLIAQLSRQVATYQAPWQQPHQPGYGEMPYNPVSGTRYKAINAVALEAERIDQGYTDPRWLTASQAEKMGGSMKPQQAGTVIQYWQFSEKRDGVEVKLDKPKALLAVVYNAQQFDGLPEPIVRVRPMEDRNRDMGNMVRNGPGALVQDANGGPARYDRATDILFVKARDPNDNPARQQMEAAQLLARWTGHPSRMDREEHPPGTSGHAQEELRVALAALMLGHDKQIGYDPGDTRAMAGPWRNLIVNEPNAFFRATVTAERIVEDLSELSRERAPVELSQEQMQELARAVNDKEQAPNLIMEAHDKLLAAEKSARYGAGGSENIRPWDRAHEAMVKVSQNKEAMAILAQSGIRPGHYEGMIVSDRESYGSVVTQQVGSAQLANAMQVYRELNIAKREVSNAILLDKDHPAMKPLDKSGRTYLAVAFAQKDEASKAGARWDSELKAWFAPPGADLAAFGRWLPDKDRIVVNVAGDPVQAFKDAAAERGLVIDGTPVIDKLTRVPVADDKRGQKSGAYTLHLDGIPAGYIENMKDGLGKQNWKATNTQQLSEKDKVELRAAAANERLERQLRDEARHAAVAAHVQEVWNRGASVEGLGITHPYLKDKEVSGQGLRIAAENEVMAWTDEKGKERQVNIGGQLLVPVYNAADELISLQLIDQRTEGGANRKQFWPGGRMEGGSNTVGNPNDTAWPLIICEGRITAEALHEMTGHTVKAALSSGNLRAVAEAERAKNPHRTIYIAVDNDHAKPRELDKNGKPKVNVGLAMGIEAASKVKGHVLVPHFDKIPKANNLTDWHDLRRAAPYEAARQIAGGLAIGRAHAREASFSTIRTKPRDRGPGRATPERQLERSGHDHGGR